MTPVDLLGAEQYEKSVHSVIKATTDRFLNHTHPVCTFTIDLSENIEIKCIVQRFEMIHLT